MTAYAGGYGQAGINLETAGGGGGDNFKQEVRVATVVPGILATDFEAGDTIDGIVLAIDDRILIKNQVAASENGIYVVQVSGAPVRSDDADTGEKLVGAIVPVLEGTVNADTTWLQTTDPPIIIDVSPIVWVREAAVNLQDAYDNSPSGAKRIALAVGAGEGIDIRDNPVPIGTALFRVTDNAGAFGALVVFADRAGIGTLVPSTAAILDCTSTTKGFLPTRWTDAEMNLIPAPPDGLMGYNSTTGTFKGRVNGEWLNMPGVGSMLLWGNNAIAASATTRYLTPGYDESTAPLITAIVQIRAPRAGNLRNMRVRQNSPVGTPDPDTITYTVRVNNVATTISATMGRDDVDASDLVNSVEIAAGDLLDIEVTKSGGIGTTPNDIVVTLEYI